MKRVIWYAFVLMAAAALTGCTRYIGTPPGPAATVIPPTVGILPTDPPTVQPTQITSHTPPLGSRVTVSEVVNSIEMRVDNVSLFEAASEGTIFGVGGQVRTGDESRVRLDLAENAIVRLGNDSLLTVEAINSEGNVPVSLIRLEQGHAWLGVNAGTLQVLTPMGIVSLGGSYAILDFSPGPATSSDDDTLTLECFDGPCTVQTIAGEQQAGRLEKLVLTKNGEDAEREIMTDTDVQSFIAFNPESSAPLFAALLQSSPPTETEAPEATETEITPEATEAATEAPTDAPTDTPTPAPTTAPSTGTLPPNGSIIGKHIVRANESMYCIGRAYGVLPDAIAQANGMNVRSTILVGRELLIPATQWRNMGNGPVCVAQFQSPFVSATVVP